MGTEEHLEAFVYGHQTLSLSRLRSLFDAAMGTAGYSTESGHERACFTLFGSSTAGAWLLGDRHPQPSRRLVRPLLEALGTPTLGYFAQLSVVGGESRRSEGRAGEYHDPSNGPPRELEAEDLSEVAWALLEVADLVGIGPVEQHQVTVYSDRPCPVERYGCDISVHFGQVAPPPSDDLPARVVSNLLDRLVTVEMLVLGDASLRPELEARLAEILDHGRRRPIQGELLEALQTHPGVHSVKPRPRWLKDHLDDSVLAVRGTGPQSVTGWF